MLVITRRSGDRISLPQVGVTVHFIRVQGSSSKIGVDAPRDILIVRDEAADDGAAAKKIREQWLRLPRQVRHEIRNELHAIGVGVHLLREQYQAGLNADAKSTFAMIQEAIERIDHNEVLKRPEDVDRGQLPGTIVVVEDDDNERELLIGVLRQHGHMVVGCRDGDEALDYINEHETPAAVLVDMRMPRCDGGAVVRSLRSDSRHSGLRIFAVSGADPAEYQVEIGEGGVDRWFRKPLNPQFLLDAI